ncbi:MAG: hypothetical protein ACI9OJ_001785 [Myxococcota bacterium]|jgi:hypothetical protein
MKFPTTHPSKADVLERPAARSSIVPTTPPDVRLSTAMTLPLATLLATTLLATTLLATTLLPGTASAVPVRVLSRTHIDITLEKRWDALTVGASLSDDKTSPVAMAEVILVLDGFGERRAMTDAAGRAAFSLTGEDLERLMAIHADDDGSAEIKVSVRYEGNPRLGTSKARQAVDLSRETLQLQAAVTPGRIERGRSPQVLAVLHQGRQPAVGLTLTATIGKQSVRATTGPRGRAAFRAFQPPPPGEYVVLIEFSGTDRFNPTTVRRRLVVSVQSFITLTRTDDGDDPMRLSVTGLLTSGNDEPMAGRVTLALDDSAWAYAEADAAGRFQTTFDLSAEATRSGPRDGVIRAVYQPAESWEVGSRSPGIRFSIPPPPRVPLGIYVAPLLILLAAFGFLAFIRSGQLGRWLASLRQRGKTPVAPFARALPPSVPSQNVQTIPSGSNTDVTGLVWNTHDQLPQSASVAVRSTGGEDVAGGLAGPDGTFAIRNLPAGQYGVHVESTGFIPDFFTITIPHRGEFVGRTIGLTPIRTLTREAYERLLALRLEHRGRFGMQTPRELEQLLGAEGGLSREQARTLTARFEAIYYRGDAQVTQEEHQATLAEFTDRPPAVPTIDDDSQPRCDS